MPEPKERRMNRRVALTTAVQVVCGDQLSTRWSHDISLGGIRLGLLDMPVFSKVKVIFIIPHGADGQKGHTCALEGEVIWKRLKAAGVRFTNLARDQESLLPIRDYVRQLS